MTAGILTGTGGSDKARFAKIGDKEYEVLDFVIRYLDMCPVGSEVEYELTESKDGKPQKIKHKIENTLDFLMLNIFQHTIAVRKILILHWIRQQ